MTKLNLLIALLLASFTFWAQKQPAKLPPPVLSEVELSAWPSDTLAEAVVLSDFGDTKFFGTTQDGLDIQFTRTTKIKIINDAGIDYATITIPLFVENTERREYVKFVQANVHNLEGGLINTTAFNPKMVYEERKNNKWINYKFTLPNAKPGSLIEYTYTVITPFIFNLPDWEFQWQIPVVSSRYRVAMVPFYSYIFLFQGATKFSNQKSWESTYSYQYGGVNYKEMISEFEMKDVSAFRDDDFITSIGDNILKIDFQLTKVTNIYGTSQNIMTTWKLLSQDLMKHDDYGRYISASERHFKGKIPFVLTTDTLENIKLAINFVKTQYEWDNTYRLVAEKKVSDFLKQKKGSSAAKNLLAIGLLKAIGIDAAPVLISTRSHGKIKSDYPFVNAFNNTLIQIKTANSLLLLDASDPYYPFGVLPLQCINDKGYLVDKKNSDIWLTLNKTRPSQMVYSIHLTPQPETDKIKTRIAVNSMLFDAVKWRKDYMNTNIDFKSKWFYRINIDSIKVDNLNEIDKSFVVNTFGEVDLEKAADKMVIYPFIGLCETHNIFKSEKREYDIDLTYPTQRVFNATIIIPDGYELVSEPGICDINTPQMQITRNEFINDKQITIIGSYVFSKAIYPASQYAQLKKSFAQMINNLNKPIILAPIHSENATSMNQ